MQQNKEKVNECNGWAIFHRLQARRIFQKFLLHVSTSRV